MWRADLGLIRRICATLALGETVNMRSKTISIPIVGIMFGVPAVVTEAFGVDVKVTCPSKSCPCTTVKVHECDAKSDGTLYNCHDVDELQCTVSGKTVKVHTK